MCVGLFTALVRRGGFLFLLHAQQISYGNTKILGDLPGSSRPEILLPSGLQICDGAPADAQLGAELTRGNATLSTETRDTGK